MNLVGNPGFPGCKAPPHTAGDDGISLRYAPALSDDRRSGKTTELNYDIPVSWETCNRRMAFLPGRMAESTGRNNTITRD